MHQVAHNVLDWRNPDEMCYPGGEEAFTRRLLDESLVMKDRVHWYTTMCGKKQTLIKKYVDHT